MNKKRILTVFFTLIVFVSGIDAYAQRAKQKYEILRLIRHEKFNLVLPGAMRDNNVDMWIHVVQDGNTDPLDLDLGGRINYSVTDTLGYYIFTDRGGDRIERAIFGGYGEEGLYDIFGTARNLRKFIEERDPKVIAVNMSHWLPIANGLSYTGYLRLTKVLGEKYAERIISAENVITDFRTRRVQREITAFANSCEIHRQIQEAALRRIQPGITTREEVGWWAQDQLLAQGIPSSLHAPSLPGVSYSEVSDPSETRKPGYAFQRGDFISWDWGIRYLNFGTDYKRKVYILKEDERDVPKGLKHAWDRVIKAREIIRKTFKIGKTAGENLSNIVRTMEDAGYVYTPFIDIGSKDREIINALGDDKRSGFSIDCHTLGNTGNGDVTSGPSMAPFRQGRFHFMVQQNNLFAFEFMIHTWVPEWGRRLSINYEDDAIVTEKGVEALYPWHDTIILIR